MKKSNLTLWSLISILILGVLLPLIGSLNNVPEPEVHVVTKTYIRFYEGIIIDSDTIQMRMDTMAVVVQ